MVYAGGKCFNTNEIPISQPPRCRQSSADSPVDLAGKLPFEWQAHGGAALGGKNEAATFDDGTGDVNMLQRG
jgi:hypothetical protein